MVGLALLVSLSETKDYLEMGFQGCLEFLRDDFICLAEMGAPLGVSDDHPMYIVLFQLLSRDFTCECS